MLLRFLHIIHIFEHILNINNDYFDNIASQIYHSGLQLNKNNNSDTEAAFLDYGVYIYQLIRFGRVCSNADDFNNINLFLTAKLLNKVIDIIKFEKHFLNSNTGSQS